MQTELNMKQLSCTDSKYWPRQHFDRYMGRTGGMVYKIIILLLPIVGRCVKPGNNVLPAQVSQLMTIYVSYNRLG